MKLKNDKDLSISTKIAQALHFSDPETGSVVPSMTTQRLIHGMKITSHDRLTGTDEMEIKPLNLLRKLSQNLKTLMLHFYFHPECQHVLLS